MNVVVFSHASTGMGMAALLSFCTLAEGPCWHLGKIRKKACQVLKKC